ncbi:MAG TPA: J domain-containing protein [Ilumatobacteraceae bacterium]|nr:J domain-containing protein [Ilumatobacteraceae bacterium]
MTDPLRILGLGPDATSQDVRAARRELAKRHHPDRGGDPAAMQAVNEAADAALQLISTPAGAPSIADEPGSGLSRDVPSFTVEALPVETFEGLLVVASWLGEVLDDDPPYRLDVHLYEPVECWCRLDLVPDAGSSTVSLTVAGFDGSPQPDILEIRDLWITNLNAVDWT